MFFVDWSLGAKTIVYDHARRRVDEVARVLGDFINYLHENEQMNVESTTIVGFSLGAHIGGLAGLKYVRGKLRKIVGVDPAGT